MIEKRIIPHEVLIRYGREGGLQGAHILEAVQILEDGEIISDVISDAKPLAFASEQFNDVIGEALRQAMGRGDAAFEEIASLNEQMASMEAQIRGQGSTLQDQKAMIDGLMGQLEEARAQFAKALGTIGFLEASLAAAQAPPLADTVPQAPEPPSEPVSEPGA